MTRPKARRKANTYPPQFQKLFLHVAQTGETVIVNNLPRNQKAEYTSFRARLNAYRKAFYDEALISANAHQQEMAETMYAVTCCDPVCNDGKWEMKIMIKENKYSDAIEELIPDTASILGEPSEEEDKEELVGGKTISELFSGFGDEG